MIEYRVFKDYGWPNHVGVEVKTSANRYVLVHNTGNGTVAEWDATKNCGKKVECGIWRPARNSHAATVDDLVKAGGTGYCVFNNNCYLARNRILERLNGEQ